MYQRLGIYKSVTEYPFGHYEKTRELIENLFIHMHGPAGEKEKWDDGGLGTSGYLDSH